MGSNDTTKFSLLFKRYDRDRSGIIEFGEFLRAVRIEVKIPARCRASPTTKMTQQLAMSDAEARRTLLGATWRGV